MHFDAWGFRSSVVESTARWSWHKRLVGVNVWIDVDGNVGEGPAPDGARVFLGGHDTDVSEADAELLRAAGWSDCIGAG